MTGTNEEGGFTTLQFERKYDTCDQDDIPMHKLCEFACKSNNK